MSVVANFLGSLGKSIYSTFSSTTIKTIYTAENSTVTIGSFSFANDTAGAITCKLYHNDGADNLVWVGSVGANTTAIVESSPVRLLDGHIIKAIANTGVTLKLTPITQLQTVPR